MDWQLGGALRLGWLLMVDPNLPGPQSCTEVAQTLHSHESQNSVLQKTPIAQVLSFCA